MELFNLNNSESKKFIKLNSAHSSTLIYFSNSKFYITKTGKTFPSSFDPDEVYTHTDHCFKIIVDELFKYAMTGVITPKIFKLESMEYDFDNGSYAIVADKDKERNYKVTADYNLKESLRLMKVEFDKIKLSS